MLIGILFVVIPMFAMADVLGPGNSNALGPGNSNTGPVSLLNPLGATSTLCGLLLKLLQVAATLAMPIMILALVYVGFKFVMARGNSTELTKAKNHLYYTVFGIGLFFAAWALAKIIAGTLALLGGGAFNTCV